MLPDLTEGLADIAVGNLTVTEERLKVVDFVAPDEKLANVEILVTGPASPAIASLDELSGQTVHVRKASSYHESLTALNDRFRKSGKPPVKLVLVPDALEDEDMMEMTNAGLLAAMVVDDWKAKLWSQVLPKLKLHEEIVLREATRKGWAIRKNSPQLAAVLNDIYASSAKKAGVIPYRQQQYMKNIKTLNNPAAGADYKRFEQMIVLFEKYGQKYNFDPLMLAAQGYQESTLDQNKKSHVGAIGVMQIMPATGQSLKVGDVKITESNIHGGAKYMDQLMSAVLQGREVRRAEPHAVRVRELQRGAGQHREACARKPRSAASIRTGGSTTSRSSRRRRSGWRPRPTCATSSSTTLPTSSRTMLAHRPRGLKQQVAPAKN